MEPLVIHVGRGSDGCAYELPAGTRARLASVPGATPTRGVVFVAAETKADFEAVHGSIEWQVALMLTGLPRTTLEALGGVVIHDPRTRVTTRLAGGLAA